MHDKDDVILYVEKAINLHNRVRSYYVSALEVDMYLNSRHSLFQHKMRVKNNIIT